VRARRKLIVGLVAENGYFISIAHTGACAEIALPEKFGRAACKRKFFKTRQRYFGIPFASQRA
jgi:hypothetical protein